MQAVQTVASLVGRILLVVIFLMSGYGKLMAPAVTREHMAEAGLPFAQFLLVCTILVELGGGLLILVGYKARLAALVMFLFLIPVTLTFHMNLAEPMQQIQLLKNLGIMGGLLMVVAFGPGPISVDGQADRIATMEKAEQAHPHI